jgi:hypothetical protein
MKQLSLALTAALTFACGIFACGGAKPTAESPTAAGDGTRPPADDGTRPPETGCAREIAIRCMSGVDGCDTGRTTEHVCIPEDATPGPPCAQELALACPEGQIDGCLQRPAVSANHICVFK